MSTPRYHACAVGQSARYVTDFKWNQPSGPIRSREISDIPPCDGVFAERLRERMGEIPRRGGIDRARSVRRSIPCRKWQPTAAGA